MDARWAAAHNDCSAAPARLIGAPGAPMSISCRCRCGASIRLPDSAVGKKARCRTCGHVFVVPGDRPPSSAGAVRQVPPVPEAPVATPVRSRLLRIQRAASTVRTSTDDARSREGGESDSLPGTPDDDADWMGPTEESFWRDAAWAFGFFLDPGNLITLIVLVLVQLAMRALAFIPFAGFFVFGGQCVLGAWLCAFYFNIIAEAARGEHELPNLWSSAFWEDMFLPALRFVGTGLLVQVPAAAAYVVSVAYGWVPTEVVWLLAALGTFFWPVFLLGAAIGECLPILAAPKLVLTVIRTFVPYLAVALLVGVAAALPVLFRTGVARLVMARMTTAPPSASLLAATGLLGEAISAYSWIVAMQLIGLYYRHFKRRFPWVAE